MKLMYYSCNNNNNTSISYIAISKKIFKMQFNKFVGLFILLEWPSQKPLTLVFYTLLFPFSIRSNVISTVLTLCKSPVRRGTRNGPGTKPLYRLCRWDGIYVYTYNVAAAKTSRTDVKRPALNYIAFPWRIDEGRGAYAYLSFVRRDAPKRCTGWPAVELSVAELPWPQKPRSLRWLDGLKWLTLN